MFLRKGVLKICSKFTGENPCRGAISLKLLSSFIEIARRHGCFPVNLLHIFRTLFLLVVASVICQIVTHIVQQIAPQTVQQIKPLQRLTM